MTKAQPIVNGMTSSNIVNLRPIKLITVPMNMQTKAAPNVTNDPTHDHSSGDTWKPYSPIHDSLSFLATMSASVGEVQPKAAPAANAPPVARNKIKINY